MATDNSQKTHLARTLNKLNEQKVASALQTLGKALPCQVMAVSGSIVTVKFLINTPTFTLPVVTIPMFGPEYIRYPTQIGDLGVTVAADTYLGGVSGLGGGVADLSIPANLSALFFMPVASTKWSATDNPNALVLYGPEGVVIRTVNKASSITVAPSGITVKNNMVLQNELTVEQLITAVTDIVINSISFNAHYHQVPGGGNTGPPL